MLSVKSGNQLEFKDFCWALFNSVFMKFIDTISTFNM